MSTLTQEHEDNDDGLPTNVAEVINVSSETVRFEIEKIRYKLPPRGIAQIHKAYAVSRVMQEGRDPVPSSIELLTNKKVLPVTDKRAASVVASVRKAG